MAKDVELNITATAGTAEVTVLQGEAPRPLLQRKPMQLSGPLSAPFEFIESFYSETRKVPENALLVKSPMGPLHQVERGAYPTASLSFYSDIYDPYQNVVKGVAAVINVLADLSLESGKKFTRPEAIKVLRRLSPYIVSQKAESVLNALANFKVSAQVESHAQDVRRGVGGQSHHVKVDADVVEKIAFSVPLFQDDDFQVYVAVDVCFDLSGNNNSVMFWFECLDYERTIMQAANDRLDTMLANIKSIPYASHVAVSTGTAFI